MTAAGTGELLLSGVQIQHRDLSFSIGRRRGNGEQHAPPARQDRREQMIGIHRGRTLRRRQHLGRASARGDAKQSCRRLVGCEHDRAVSSPTAATWRAGVAAERGHRSAICRHFAQLAAHSREKRHPSSVRRQKRIERVRNPRQRNGLQLIEGADEQLPARADIRDPHTVAGQGDIPIQPARNDCTGRRGGDGKARDCQRRLRRATHDRPHGERGRERDTGDDRSGHRPDEFRAAPAPSQRPSERSAPRRSPAARPLRRRSRRFAGPSRGSGAAADGPPAASRPAARPVGSRLRTPAMMSETVSPANARAPVSIS